MSLYWPDDPNKIDLTGARLHAFIIGVGDYPHLVAGVQNAFNSNFGLQQLTTTVLTAKRIAKWLATEYHNPDVPLGSIELFLSPAQDVDRPDGSKAQIEDATMANVKAAFRARWLQQRCLPQPGGITFFYFAGHGLSSGGAPYLLLSDFADQAANKWDNCIDFSKSRAGMGHVKATQLFFVDACRETPIDALTQANPPTGVRLVDDATMYDQPDSEATYFAAADGRQAYGPDDDHTYFSTAVIDALDGAAALKKQGKVAVDTFQLATAIGQIVGSLAGSLTKPLTCNPQPSGKPAVVHLPKAAHARTSIVCVSAQANAESAIRLKRGNELIESAAGKERPWFGRVAPGDWELEVTFANLPQYKTVESVNAPLHEVEVPV
jgi:hypothetical protein